MPAKFDIYVLDKKVKYDINSVVNYSNLSIDNFIFSNNLNKIHKPRTFAEAANDPRWVEAMNQEMEALNNNNTWEITDLPKGRKAISSKSLFNVKYQSNRELERFKARYKESFSPVVKIVNVRCLLIVTPAKAPIPNQSKKIKDKIESVVDHAIGNIKCSLGTGISFKLGSDLSLSAYVDYDWAKCKITRKSVTGYVVYMGMNIVS
ncbi:putative RNA-directed DNA polymerase [Tanacetum coccineum]